MAPSEQAPARSPAHGAARRSVVGAPGAQSPPAAASAPATSAASAPAWPIPAAQPGRTEQDVRRKRPPMLSFLLRLATIRRAGAVVVLLAADFLGVAAAIFTALAIKALARGSLNAGEELHETLRLLPLPYLLTVLLFWGSALYASRPKRPGLTRIVASLFQATVVAWLFAVVTDDTTYSSYYIFYGSLAFALIYVPLLRLGYESITGVVLRAAGYRRRAVLVGTGKHISDVAGALCDTARSGGSHSPVEVVGYLAPSELPSLDGLRSLGTISDIDAVLDGERVDELIIADPDFPQADAVELVDRAHRRGVRVCIAPSTMEILVTRAEFVPGESVPLFELGPPAFEGIDFALKRGFDIVAATLLLVALSPLLVAIVIAVRLTSRGPVLFRSMRPGIGQRPFACLKFRTMYIDAEHRQADLDALNEASGALFKIRDDPRLTPVGGFLRRFSLDELPQLINVLRGEMSLVGPRPLPERDFALLEDWHRKRYLVLPGMTGLWQVSGRSELDFDDLVRLDFIYLERWSLALDLAIIAKTIPAVLTRRGAY
ncbi:MAG: sugar transferase [Acidobacteriota bacterium]|nr:sugar transferase [Acidobacteriota bacterium]